MNDPKVTVTVESSVIEDAITALDYISKHLRGDPHHDYIDRSYYAQDRDKLRAAFDEAIDGS